MTIGPQALEACPDLAYIDSYLISDFESGTPIVTNALAGAATTIDCSYDVNTPFNGEYIRLEVESHGKPVYISGSNFFKFFFLFIVVALNTIQNCFG